MESVNQQIREQNFGETLSEKIRLNLTKEQQRGYYFLLYENDLLTYWSDNRISFDENPAIFGNRKLLKLRNAWFESFVSSSGNKKLIGLLLLKNEYSYQNKYLENVFNPDLETPSGAELHEHEGKNSFVIKEKNGNPLFYLSFPSAFSENNDHVWLVITLYILSVLCFCYFIHELGVVVAGSSSPLPGSALFLLLILAARTASVYFEFPDVLYKEAVFDSRYFASSSYLSSLGDLLVNTITGFYILFYLNKNVSFQVIRQLISRRKSVIVPLLIISFAILISFAFTFLALIKSLIINSNISFNVNDLFSLDSFSLYSFIIIGFLFSAFFLLSDSVINFFVRNGINPMQFLISLGCSTFLYLVVSGLMNVGFDLNFDRVSTLLFTSTFFSIIFYLRLSETNLYSFSATLLFILLFSFICSMKISLYNEEKEKASRILLAEKLDKEQDHVAEHLFTDIEKKVAGDSVLLSLFDTSSQGDDDTHIESGVKRIHQIYFNGFWSKYDSKLHAYDASGIGLFSSNNENVGLDYFQKIITDFGIPTYSNNFIFLSNSSGRTSYIARLPILKNSGLLGTIIVELDSKLRQEESGFPDLLLSGIVSQSQNFISSDYSYARYKNGKLTFRYGVFPYFQNAYSFGDENSGFIEEENYSHLLYRSSAGTLVVVSQKKSAVFDYITLFSYLSAFFSLFIILLSTIKALPVSLRIPFFSGSSFSGRIQRSMMLIVLISLLVTGSGTAWYIIRKYNSEQVVNVRARMNSLLVSVQNQLGYRENLSSSILQNMTYDLMNLSLSSSSDFNIYDLKGNMLFSTQPKIYEQEIISEKINSSALRKLKYLGKSSVIQNENIGNLGFIAAYEPIRNSDNVQIGYIGLPYFSNQSELKKEISSFLVALMNIYVLLFALALLLSFVATARITQPLRVIRQRIGKFRIGGKNEPIQWNSQDEIGELISEYNRMVVELEQSADRLAKSERESAWREMAKQVAHEIKNPLTPMKLSIQHLQKAWNEKSPQMDEILKKISVTIVQQIDTLSTIASEFSNFAQMPHAKNRTIDLVEILQQTCNLFSEDRRAGIDFQPTEKNRFLVHGDYDQLSRVFTNLINNAMEAIPNEKEGQIEIKIFSNKANHVVSVSDNGSGIDSALQDKIFEPNFTTKSSGMGLGLAMVKNICESLNGNIRFETTEGKGTTFFVSIPAHVS